MTLSYNSRNQTDSITPPGGTQIDYTYRSADQTRRATAGNTVTTDSTLCDLAETTGSTRTDYLRRDDTTLAAIQHDGASYYPISDGLGSVTALTDANGNITDEYRYSPYGRTDTITQTVPNPYRYAGVHGYHHDTDTGFHKVGHRYLNTNIARWTQQDPTYQETNPYNYANCNPQTSSTLRGRTPRT